MALNGGLQRDGGLWSEEGRRRFRALPMLGNARRRHDGLLKLLTELDAQILALDVVVRRRDEEQDDAPSS